MTRHQVFAIGFFALLLGLLYQLALIFSPFLFPALWALILAHMAFPLHVRLTTLLRQRATLSAALLTAVIMALGVVPVVALATMLIREVGTVYADVNVWVQTGGVDRLREGVARLSLMGPDTQEIIGRVLAGQGNIEDFLLKSATALRGFLIQELTGLAKNAFLLAEHFLVMVLVLFFFFKDGQRLLDSLYRVMPLEASHKQKIFSRLDQTMRAVIKGVVLTAILQGLLAGTAYAALGVPFPVFLMALTMLLAPLPFGGTALIWGPVAAYLYWVGPAWKALALLLWGAGVVTMVDNILKPLLIGQGAQLPVLFLFFSILGGLATYGLIGLFLGPILLALLLTVIQIYREDYQQEEPAPPAAS